MAGITRRQLLFTMAIATASCRAQPQAAEVRLTVKGMI